ncbi:MAG: ribonuclease HII [Candidatus Aenigmatarchaeota archaeon]
MIVAGIDENGRGCIIGPLVITVFIIDDEKINELEKIGVKDSKKIHPKKRKEIYEKLISLGEIHQKIISAIEIDYYLKNKKIGLNNLEIIKIAELINETNSEIYYIDAISNPIKFKEKLKKFVKRDVEIIAENKMDEKNLVVAAASIIGKVVRDMEIEKIKERINFDFGSGYVSDERTKKFIEYVVKKGLNYDFIRKSWITYEEENKKIKFKKLIDFI